MKASYSALVVLLGFCVAGCGRDPNSPLVVAQEFFDRTAEGDAGFEWDNMSKIMQEKHISIQREVSPEDKALSDRELFIKHFGAKWVKRRALSEKLNGDAVFVVYERDSSTSKSEKTHGVVKLVKEDGKWKQGLVVPEDHPFTQAMLGEFRKANP